MKQLREGHRLLIEVWNTEPLTAETVGVSSRPMHCITVLVVVVVAMSLPMNPKP